MNEEDKNKPTLPYGWIVKQSKSYPDRVYYFNLNTGATTWEVPDLIKPYLDAQKNARNPNHAPSHPHTTHHAAAPPNIQGRAAMPAVDSGNHPAAIQPVEASFSPEPQFSPEMDSDGSRTPRSYDYDEPYTGEGHIAMYGREHEQFYSGGRQRGDNLRSKSNFIIPGPQPIQKPVHCINSTNKMVSSSTYGINATKPENAKMKQKLTPVYKPNQDASSVTSKTKVEVKPVLSRHPEVLRTSSNTSVSSNKSNKSAKMTKNLDSLSKKPDLNLKSPTRSTDKEQSKTSSGTPGKKRKSGVNAMTDSIKSSATESKTISSQVNTLVISPHGKKRKWKTDMAEPSSAKVAKKMDTTTKINKSADVRKVVQTQNDSRMCSLSDRKDGDACNRDRTNSGDSSVQSVKSPHISDPEKLKSIQSWINQCESGEPLSDPFLDIPDGFSTASTSDTKRTSPDSGILSVTCDSRSDNRRVIISGDSGYSEKTAIFTVNSLWNNTLSNSINNNNTRANNPWKGVHTQPAPLRQDREVMDMEIDEVQHELNEAESREVEDMEVCEIAVKEVREHLKKCPNEVIGKLTENYFKDEPPLSLPQNVNQRLLIVVDTNIWMDHLGFVEDLRDQQIKGYGCPVIVVPWVVMQELDALKNRKNVFNLSLATEKKARAPVNYLYNCFEMKHPRILGQTGKQALEVIDEFTAENNDDRILQCCLQCQKNYSQSRTVLLTNDKNLNSKALILGIKAFTRMKLLAGLQGIPTTKMKNATATGPDNSKPPDNTVLQKDTMDKAADDILCKSKVLMKTALSVVLEKEMKSAYDDMWLQIVLRKPPWTLVDVLECFKKHWMAVFGQIYKRSLKETVDKLYDIFKPFSEAFVVNKENVQSMLNDILSLLEECNRVADYGLQFKEAFREMKSLQGVCLSEKPTNKVKPQVKSSTVQRETISQPSSSVDHVTSPKAVSSPEQTYQLQQVAEAKFDKIWQIIQKCCSDIQGYLESGTQSPEISQEVVTVLTKLVSVVKDLRYHYSLSLSSTPEEIQKTPALVHDVCVLANSFYPRMDLPENEGDVPVAIENVKSLFGDPVKRFEYPHRIPVGDLLQTGLNVLDEMIKKIYRYARMMMND